MIALRAEQSGEQDAVFAIHTASFETDLEARLVNRLRADGDVLLSLMAVGGDAPVGSLILSPVSAEADGARFKAAAIGPVSVLPDRQGDGIGSALIRAGIAWARDEGFVAIFLLGSPDYYRRFGFPRRWRPLLHLPMRGRIFRR